MDKKGFTLIELLATLVLLAMITMIAIPAVNSVLANNKQKNCDTLRESIIEAAKLYVSDNKYTLTWRSNTTTVKLTDLYNSDIESNTQYLNASIKNPCDNTEYTGDNIEIQFIINNGAINYKKITKWPSEFNCCQEKGASKK